MAQFVISDQTVEVNGETVTALVNGLGAFKNTALKALSENGIENPVAGQWYSLAGYLKAYKTIADAVGAATLTNIGRKIPENAQFPPGIDDIEKALDLIDVAYYMNHRKSGKVLFDGATGKKTEAGIGHYKFEKVADNKLKMTVDVPYPCDFDKGIIESMAKKFKPKEARLLKIAHDEGACRKTGAASCVYWITW